MPKISWAIPPPTSADPPPWDGQTGKVLAQLIENKTAGIGVFSGQEALANAMLVKGPDAKTGEWPVSYLEAAARGGMVSIYRQMLSEPHHRFGLTPRADLSPAIVAADAVYRRSLCWTAALPKNVRVRMAGVNDDGTSLGFGDHRRGHVTLRLDAPTNPTLLVLVGYDPEEWQIVRTRGSKLAGVILLGYSPQDVSGDIGGATVLPARADRCPALQDAPYSAFEPGDDQRRLADAVARMIGRPVDSFVGEETTNTLTVVE